MKNKICIWKSVLIIHLTFFFFLIFFTFFNCSCWQIWRNTKDRVKDSTKKEHYESMLVSVFGCMIVYQSNSHKKVFCSAFVIHTLDSGLIGSGNGLEDPSSSLQM